MADYSDPDIHRYYVTVADHDSEYDIVLPGRSDNDAKRAADLLLAGVGPHAFSPASLDAPSLTDEENFRRDEDARIKHWLAIYDRISDLYPDRRAMAEYFDVVEFQIGYAIERNHAKIDPKSYQRYEQQKAARALPNAIVPAAAVSRPASNPFQPRSTLPRENLKAVQNLIRIMEVDIPESEVLHTEKRNAYIAARIAISRQADQEIAKARANVNAMFKPIWRDLARQEAHAGLTHPTLRSSFFKSAEPVVLAAPAIAVARKTMLTARNGTLREATAPILKAKMELLLVQDSSYQSFRSIAKTSTRIGTEFMQEQWRKHVGLHARQRHGPNAAPNPASPAPQKSFFDRIAEQVRNDPAPARATEQNNHRDQERD